jgi:hypothetical protein
MESHLAGHVRTLEGFLIHLRIVTLGITVANGALQACERAPR